MFMCLTKAKLLLKSRRLGKENNVQQQCDTVRKTNRNFKELEQDVILNFNTSSKCW